MGSNPETVPVIGIYFDLKAKDSPHVPVPD